MARGNTSPPPRIAFSTLAFPDATLTAAAALGRGWGYSGIELRLTRWLESGR